jgi:hypothetical protein
MKFELLIVLLIPAGLVGGFVLSQIRWHRINNPEGKFTNVGEYLAHGRLPARVTKVQRDGNTYFIAYGPMDYRIAVPSGPAAYVFDQTGQMVDWSSDTGDDRTFMQRWFRSEEKSSIEELKQIGFQQAPAGEVVKAVPEE